MESFLTVPRPSDSVENDARKSMCGSARRTGGQYKWHYNTRSACHRRFRETFPDPLILPTSHDTISWHEVVLPGLIVLS